MVTGAIGAWFAAIVCWQTERLPVTLCVRQVDGALIYIDGEELRLDPQTPS
jgi:hypothetical protein